MTRDDLVKAADFVITRTGYMSIERMASAVVAKLEPLIREAIAQQIEEKADDLPLEPYDVADWYGAWEQARADLHDAARIARGESGHV